MVFCRDQEWREIFRESTLRHDDPTDADALMKTRTPADDRPVVDAHMAAKQGIIRDHHAVPDPAIVPDVNADHYEIPIAENCRATFRRATMDGAMFPNHVGSANFYSALSLRLKTQILRRGPDDCYRGR